MVALRGKEIDAFLARPDPSRPIILLYGPDAGLVRERADALMASAVDDPNDPFSLVRMDGDELAAEPSRLVDEAMTVPLFGGRRAIRIRAGSRSFASGIDTLAEMQPKDCRIVIEAGELRPDAPLRKACEKAKTAVAIAFSMEDAQRMCDFCQAYYGTGAGGFEEPLALAPAGYLLPFVNAQGERITLSLSTDVHQDPNMSQDHFILAFNDLPSYDVSS